MQLPIRRSTCPLRFPSFTGSIMMVYRITVLSFLHPALMSDHWLLFSPEHYAEFISERCRRLSPSSDESAPDTRQSRKWRIFFSVAALTTVKHDLFTTRYAFLRGGRGGLKPVLKGNVSQERQPSLCMDFFFHLYMLFLWFSVRFPTFPCLKDKFT